MFVQHVDVRILCSHFHSKFREILLLLQPLLKLFVLCAIFAKSDFMLKSLQFFAKTIFERYKQYEL